MSSLYSWVSRGVKLEPLILLFCWMALSPKHSIYNRKKKHLNPWTCSGRDIIITTTVCFYFIFIQNFCCIHPDCSNISNLHFYGIPLPYSSSLVYVETAFIEAPTPGRWIKHLQPFPFQVSETHSSEKGRYTGLF